MNEEEQALIAPLFEAIDAHWALCDDRDEDEHMVLVDENRDLHPTLMPAKTLVKKLEHAGYIRLDAARSDDPAQPRQFMEVLGDTVPVPFVYFYEITAEGRDFRDTLVRGG